MQPIRAHLLICIRSISLILTAAIAGLISGNSPAHAATGPAQSDPELHTSRDGVFRQVIRAVITRAQAADAALPLHKVRAGESISSVAADACDGQARDWTGIYAASRDQHLTSRNANVLTVGQLLAIRCVYLPGELRYAPAPHHRHQTMTTAYVRSSGGGGHHDPFDGQTQYECGDGDGDGAHDMPCSLLHHHAVYHGGARSYRHAGRTYRRVTVYRGSRSSRYSGSGGCQSHIIGNESGGNARAVNPSSGAGGLYQFLPSTWHALGHSGLAQNASVAEQNQAYHQQVTQSGYSAWAASGGC